MNFSLIVTCSRYFYFIEPEVKEVTFLLKKISERHVKKFNAASCVFRASMENQSDTGEVQIKDIMSELSSLFTNTVEQVRSIIIPSLKYHIISVAVCFSSYCWKVKTVIC